MSSSAIKNTRSPRRTIKKILVSLSIILFLYLNIASLVRVTGLRFPKHSLGVRGPMPNHWLTEESFRMFDLFDRVTRSAVHFQALGTTEYHEIASPKPTEDMIDLNIYQYFPQVLGEANRRVGMHSYYNHPRRRKLAYIELAGMLQDIHNREHPDNQVKQVYIYVHWWPKSKFDFFQRYEERVTLLEGHN